MPAGETENSPSPWTIDSLHQHIVDALAALRSWAEAKFGAHETAVDAALATHDKMLTEMDRRYEQRFHAQEGATALALARVDKEFHEHLAQVRAETHAALEAADKAIAKAESATEKRFEGVNEFRAQLADQTRTFIPRTESISRHERTAEQIEALVRADADIRDRLQNQTTALMPRSEAEQRIAQNAEKIATLEQRHSTDVATINSRLDLAAGRGTGLTNAWGYLVALVAAAGGVIAIVVALSR